MRTTTPTARSTSRPRPELASLSWLGDLNVPIAGKFKVERCIGEGGMGVVVAARHIELDERVVLKILRPELIRDEQVVERFAREARLAVKLKNAHVARVMDVGALESGLPFIVMEYLDGTDLSAAIRRDGKLPVPLAARYLIEACLGLAEAHAHGIVHRDIKPENLFLARESDGTCAVKILDFGISKQVLGLELSDDGQPTTHVIGTPLYMAPEQFTRGVMADPRMDVWSLGCVFFEAVTGRSVFTSKHVVELVDSIRHDPIPYAADLVEGLDPQVDAVVQGCLERKPEARFQNVSVVAAALLPLAPEMRAAVEKARGTMLVAGTQASDLPPMDVIARSSERTPHAIVTTPTGRRALAAQRPTERSTPKVIAALGASSPASPPPPIERRWWIVTALIFAAFGAWGWLRRPASTAVDSAVAAAPKEPASIAAPTPSGSAARAPIAAPSTTITPSASTPAAASASASTARAPIRHPIAATAPSGSASADKLPTDIHLTR